MIVAIGTYSAIGGLKTLTDSYMADFQSAGIPCRWILFGHEEIPHGRLNDDHFYARLSDPWDYYVSADRIDQKLKSAIHKKIESWKPRIVFRPLELSFEPYLDNLPQPIALTAQLLRIPLLESAKRQKYFDEKEVAQSVRADQVRLAFERQSFERAQFLISNSETTRRGLELRYPAFFPKHGLCSPLGANEIFFRTPSLAIRSKALFFGRLNYQKGISHLLREVPKDWSLTVTGQGKWRSEQFTKFGIRHLDWVHGEDLINEIAASTFCLFPSHYEPWGMSLTEALASGRICIAQSGAGGHEEQIEHGKNGFLFDFNSGDFWELLKDLKSHDPSELMKISEEARQSARPWRTHSKEICDYLTALSAKS